jgi:hypothetical protein
MKYTGPYTYKLNITDNGEDRVIDRREFQDKVVKTFSYPLTSAKRPKIYIIEEGSVFHYVGYSSQSITTRIRNGLKKADTYKGYNGYHWKKLNSLYLHVFVFDDVFKTEIADEDKDGNRAYKAFAEAVEAEIAFFVRNKTGKWPVSQNEIHFNNIRLPEAVQIAENMYRQIFKP